MRAIKTYLLLGIIFISVIIAFLPTVSGAPFDRLNKAYALYSQIQVDYDKHATEEPFLPVDMVQEIPLTVNYRVAGVYADQITPVYVEDGNYNYIHLYVEETPEWCTVSLMPSFLIMPALSDWNSVNSSLIVKVNENALAYSEGTIKLRIEVEKMGAINGGTFYQDIPFKPGYLPFLKINALNGATALIGPEDIATFDIEVENLGNAKTQVESRILALPKGWTATITSNAILESTASEQSKKDTDMIQLVVKPPINFGYHNDRESIKVSIIPLYFDNNSLAGEEYQLSFIVQSRGFSIPSFEFPIIIVAVMMFFFFRKQSINKKTTVYREEHR